MAIIQETVTANGSFSNLSISRKTTKTGNITWTLPSLPDGYTIISTSLTANLNISMLLGSCTVTINSNKYTSSSSLSIDMGTTLKSSLSVSAVGKNNLSYGTVSISNIVYTITYSYDDGSSEPPVISILSQDLSKISSINGKDRCTVSFNCDKALSYWEARATLPNVIPSHGVGLLVESGTLSKGETGYVYVDDDELTNGDANYTITIYGQTSDGVWSDE